MTMLFEKRNIGSAEINTGAGSRQRDETTIVESPNDAIIGRTLDGIVCDWNAAAEVMFAYSTTEIVGRIQSIGSLSVPL